MRRRAAALLCPSRQRVRVPRVHPHASRSLHSQLLLRWRASCPSTDSSSNAALTATCPCMAVGLPACLLCSSAGPLLLLSRSLSRRRRPRATRARSPRAERGLARVPSRRSPLPAQRKFGQCVCRRWVEGGRCPSRGWRVGCGSCQLPAAHLAPTLHTFPSSLTCAAFASTLNTRPNAGV